MDVGVCDPKLQVKEVAVELKAMNTARLYDAIDIMSTSLVMGFERYLRKFDSEVAIPLLADVCETFIREDDQGDLIVMSLRALSLTMEHVPSSYEAAQLFHRPLMQLSSKAIHKSLCMEWHYTHCNNASMIEEGLRVMRFISKDDMTGELIQYALVGDLLTLCTDPQPLVARQALETLFMMSSKVVMPSELDKPTKSTTSGFLSFFKGKKKSSRSSNNGKSGRNASSLSSSAVTAAGDIVPYADHPTVVQVENVIAPLLVSLVEQYAKSLASIPEHWGLLELALESLGTLIERALICHRPHTARALSSPLLPRILFQLIVTTESNIALEPNVRVDRVLLCETTLTLLTHCHRDMMLESLQLPVAHKFFRLILGESTDEITTLLEDPFPRAVIAARSTQRRDKDHITSVAALQLFVLACPTVPSDAFGLRPKLVLPVHQWMWEDELRHDNCLMEEQCVSLETSWTRLDHKSRITVHLKQLDADLRAMTMSKGARGGHRNISRRYVPFVYHFADEMALRPIVAVKEAGPCSIDGTTLVWKSGSSATKNDRSATATAVAVSERQDSTQNTLASNTSKHSKTKQADGGSSPPASPSTASLPQLVVLNTQQEVPAKHIAIAEEYFSTLCLFAKNTSGQMAKQVATCACASMLQLMFLSGASGRFEGLMGKAVLPMCEMFREALISADKATKAVVLTMIGWMLYHPMADPCEFTESALRCGLLDQLNILSKTTLLVKDKPTRTASLAEKAGALAGTIVEKIKERRAAQVGGVGTNASVTSDTPLGGVFLSGTMLTVKKALEDLRSCRCGKQAAVVASSSATSPAGPKAADKTHEPSIKELLRIFNEATDITAYEVFNVGVASTLLYYLLGDMTLEELVGENVVHAAGASASTLTKETVNQLDSHIGPIDSNRNASSWATMMASGMHAADILAMFVDEKRMGCLMQWAVKYPTGMRRLVSALVANIPLQSHLPLVESVVTFEKVVCKTPLQAHEALCRIAPLIMLCGDAGRRISAAIKNGNANEAKSPTSAPTNAPSSSAERVVTAALCDGGDGNGNSNNNAGAGVSQLGAEFTPGNVSAGGKQTRSNSALTSNRGGAANVLRGVPNAENVARIAKECCMEGHRLRFIEVYPITHRCDRCARSISGGYNCYTCNYDVCEGCYTHYTGNLELIKSIAAMERNRVHLCASIGDLERWFRTGSTSSKGTQLAPTSQSSLHHLERFTVRVQIYLSRYITSGSGGNNAQPPSVTVAAASAGGTSHNSNTNNSHKNSYVKGGGTDTSKSDTLLSLAIPTDNNNATSELAEKLLNNPNVVRRLTYRYLSRFATRGALSDEGVPITPEYGDAMDAEVAKVLPTETELRAAEDLVQEGVEERYLLYRPSCGLLPLQETVLSTLYRRAFALGNQEVLLQLENCLMRLDSVGEEPLRLQRNGEVTMSNPAAATTRKRNPNLNVFRKQRAGSALPVAGNRPGLIAMTSAEKCTEASEFEQNRVAADQTYLFHHFENDAATYCSCGAHSRAEFHTEEPPALTFTAPDLASRTDMLLLILLYRVLFEDVRGPVKYATEAHDVFGGDTTIFENNTITTAVVRSLEASALRVSMLPPQYALPRWVNFLLREGRFLIPLAVRSRVARFLAYGARRSFTRHMRIFRNQRNDYAVSILPGEWARMSNHKYTIDRDVFVRDAYVMLRKCADARFPISFEFKGDIGVGQGPTAQFYTLLAAEASKEHAELWRVNSDTQTATRSIAATANAASPVHAVLPKAQLAPSISRDVHVSSSPVVGAPPTSLPTRRSSVTPTSSPPRNTNSLPASVTNQSIVNNISSSNGNGCGWGPLSSSEVTPRHSQKVHHVPSTAKTSASTSLVSLSSVPVAAEEGACLVPPSEGFYPRHLDGVLRYPDDVDSMPCTPLIRRSHSHAAREELSISTLASQSSGHLNFNPGRPVDGSFNNAGTTSSNSVSAKSVVSAVHYDMNKAVLLVDSNVGLLRDFVIEQRERVRAYYAVGAALGRAFLDEQVFPLPLSPALAYFIRRHFPAYQLVLSDATRIDPSPEFPIDVFELPMSAAAWVDQSVAQSLASLGKLDSATLAALDLPFTLPGDDNFELLPGGASMTVTTKNLRVYQRRVVGALLYESVAVPLYFLTMGCRDVVPYEALQVMDVEELIGMLCGEGKHPNEPLWTTEEVRSVLVGDHGYQNDSPQLESLARVLGARLTPSEQRDFLLFCTGCPRLPIGGIRALGAITVVKRSNAFAEARNAAVRVGSSASIGGGSPGLDGEEDEEGRPLPGMYDHTALSDQEDSSTAIQETPRPDLVSTGPATSEEATGAAGGAYSEPPDSEWALPSVNTCFRYLKLPPYPTEELLYKKLLQSITQTGGTFELS